MVEGGRVGGAGGSGSRRWWRGSCEGGVGDPRGVRQGHAQYLRHDPHALLGEERAAGKPTV